MKQLLRLNAMGVIILMTTLVLSCNSEKKEDGGDKKMADNTESQLEKNKKTALASVNALLAGNVEETLKDVTTDAVDYGGEGSTAVIKGKDSIIVALHSWRDALSEYKGDNIWAMAEGDHVVVIGDWSGTFKTDFMGVKSTGKSFKVKDVDIFTFNSEGKITEHRNIQSSAAMLWQIGAMVMAK